MPTPERRRSRFVRLILPFLHAEPRQVTFRLAALVALLLTLASLNVVASFVNRDVMTTIAERRTEEFTFMALKWVGIFGVVTAVAVFYRFAEETLALFWRRWMTGWLVGRYLADRRYY